MVSLEMFQVFYTVVVDLSLVAEGGGGGAC